MNNYVVNCMLENDTHKVVGMCRLQVKQNGGGGGGLGTSFHEKVGPRNYSFYLINEVPGTSF